jgi:two-component system cell cycle sensor histidine kinase/response regulator CckA
LQGVEDEGTARGFHLFLACVLVWIALLLAVGVPFFAARPTATGLACLLLGAVTLGALYLVRAGRVRAASLLFLLSIWCTTEVSSALGGGLRGGVYPLIVLIIVNAGWLLGRASALALAAATLLVALAESLAEYFGHPLPLYLPGNAIGRWMFFAGTLLFAVNPVLAILETLRRQVAALRESEERFRRVFDEGPIGLALVGEDLRIARPNAWLCRTLGYTEAELMGMSIDELTHPDDRATELELSQRLFQDEIPLFKIQKRLVKRNGDIIWGNLVASVIRDQEGVPLYGLGMLEDITQRKRAEEEREKLQAQLMEAQRMESIGRLAGGVAHDFNNLLTIINGYGQLALGKLTPADPLRATIEEIHRAGERAAGFTQQLLAFSRKQVLQPRVLDINRVVGQMQPMLTRLVGEDVELSIRLHPEGMIICADQHHLEQVIMNLVANARDAMPNGGTLQIETSAVERGESASQSEAGRQAGAYVMLMVADDGAGMDAETSRHIFEPFFTTKEVGKGTGLGLSMVHGIVEQSGGYIEVESKPDRGTTIRIYLPRVLDAPEDLTDPEEVPVQVVGGTETVLVVDDQAEVRKYAADALRGYGYRVIQAKGASEALAICEQEPELIDLVLTDVVMPNMSGGGLADLLAKQWPDIEVLFMSGYTNDATGLDGVPRKTAGFIQKPFSPDQLALKVRELLAAPDFGIPPEPPAQGELKGVARILVADDEAGVRGFLRMVLEGGGYEVIEAANGKQAIQQVRAERVDILITDLVMPEQEGIETITTLRKESASIPIIAISGAFGGSYLKIAHQLGAQAALVKPVNADQLLTTVAELLKSRR